MSKIEPADLQELQQGFRGEMLSLEHPAYDSTRRIWNGIFDRKPAIIVRPVTTPDVIKAVRFAKEHSLALAIRGGGHNSAGTGCCDGGMMLDLSLMRRVNVDPKTRTVRADGGALLGDMDAETQLHGLAVSSGIVSHTGVGGLTLGGGFGWLTRKYGMSIDNLLSADLVTATGKVITASAKDNPDLFWGLRGGGGNFGVVTSFTFQAADIGTEVYSGLIVKRFEDLKAYYRFHRDYVRTMPDEMTIWSVTRLAPPLPFLPPESHGKLIVAVPFVYLGDPISGEKLIAPVRKATPSVGEHIGVNPWTAWQQTFDPLVTHGARNYWKTHQLTEIPDAFLDVVEQYALSMPSPECEIFVPHLEGKMARIPEDETAFGFRKAPFNLNIHTRWQKPEDDERCKKWARDLHSALTPFAKGAYVNFLSDLDEEQLKSAYTPATLKRLTEIKNKWDPQNLFSINQNIKPRVPAMMEM